MSDAQVLPLREGRYFLAVAFVYGDEARDWLMSVWRDETGPWHVSYRFRYYDGLVAGPFNDDTKKFYSAKCNRDRSEADLIASMRAAATLLMVQDFNDTIDLLELRTDDPKAIVSRLQERPWFSMKAVESAS